jgi:hypothetical protein
MGRTGENHSNGETGNDFVYYDFGCDRFANNGTKDADLVYIHDPRGSFAVCTTADQGRTFISNMLVNCEQSNYYMI